MREIDPDLHEALRDLARRLAATLPRDAGCSVEDALAISEREALGMQRAGAQLYGLLASFDLVTVEEALEGLFRSNLDS